jgi:hypothetical protein
MTEQLIVVRRPIFPDILETLCSGAGAQPPDLLNKEE